MYAMGSRALMFFRGGPFFLGNAEVPGDDEAQW